MKILQATLVSTPSSFASDASSVKVKIDATEPQLLATSVVFSTSDTNNDDDPDLTSTSTLLAKNGEAIYFDFDTDERIETPSVSVDGSALSAVSPRDGDPSGMRWRATYTPSVNADVSAVSFSVDGFEDPAGNTVITPSSFASDASSVKVKIDVTEPQLLAPRWFFPPAIQRNDDDPDLTSTSTLLAKNGEAIYFDFDTDERIETPSVSVDGSVSSAVSPRDGDPSGMRWRATYTPSVNADVSAVSFSVDGFEDPAGNTRERRRLRLLPPMRVRSR